MSIIRNVQKKRLFIRFMISYIIMLSIPLSVTLLIYNQSVGIVKKDALEANLNLLEQSRNSLEKGLNQVNSLSVRLAFDTKLKALLYEKGPMDGRQVNSLFELFDMWSNLPPGTVTGDLIKKFYVILPGTQIVLSDASSYNLPDFYGWIYRHENMKFEEWETLFLKQYHNKDILPSAKVYTDGNTRRYITYLQSMPLEVAKQPLGTVMILIDEEEVLKSLGRINTEGGGDVYIVDNKGKVIASKNGSVVELPKDILGVNSTGYSERKVNNQDLLYSYTTSPMYGWRFVAVLPSSAVMGKVTYIRNITITAILLCFIIGMLVAYFLSYRNIKPIKEAIKILSTRISGGHSEEVDEYNYLCSAVSKLVENDIELSQKLEQNIPLAQAVFLQRLVKGELTSSEELNSTLQQVRLEMQGSRFNVLMAYIKGYYGLFSKETLQELNVIKEILKSFGEEGHSKVYPIDVDESTVAFILAYPQEDEQQCKEELQDRVRAFSESLVNKYGVAVDFAAGNYYGSLSDIYYSFSEARHALGHGKADCAHGISWYSEIDHDEWVYYYPIDLEQRLINLVKAGNKRETEKILDVIYRENFQKYNITWDMVKNLHSEMRGTIFKILSQISLSENEGIYSIYNMLKQMKHSNTASDAFAIVKEALLYICGVVDSKKLSQNSQLKDEIVQFLQETYRKQEMCLAFVAAKFDLSEVYLSNFFKEQTGENFSDYIEKLRIEAACQLLTQSKLSVEEIALQAGYNSAHAFRRAFKRSKGILPTELRKG